MSKLLNLLFIFLLFFSCTQISNKDLPKEVETYNHYVAQAESFIMEGKYDKAIEYYGKSYDLHNYMFAVDIENVLICCIQLKDWDKSIFWVEQLIKKGVTIVFFDSKRFELLRKSRKWENFLKSYEEIYSEFQNTRDKNLIDSLAVLKEIDQLQYCQIGIEDTKFADVIPVTIQVDSLFTNLIKNNGFPSEEKTGVNIIKDTILSSYPSFGVLLRHSYQANSNYLDSLSTKAVKNMELKKEVYRSIVNDNFSFIVIANKIYEDKIFTTYIADKEEIDFLRRKIVFKYSKNKEGFNFYTPLASFENLEIEEDGIYTFLVDYKE